jgi:SAM-dependent methyltransferase
LNRPYRRSLDVGGSVGIFSRFLRANGVAKHVTVCDIKDGRKRFSPLRYFLFWFKYKFDTLASRLPLSRKWGVLRKNNNKYGYGTTMRSNVWNMGLWRLPKLDNYIAGDFMTFKSTERFDLIVSVNAIEYFNYEKLLRRVHELLEDGGVFCFLVNYWWYPVNSITVYGDFPYLAQRLTKEDVKRYYNENFPDQTDAMIKRYEYFNQGEKPPVLNDLIECAHRNGLVLAGTERIMPKPWSRDHRSPFAPEELPVQDVLDDIKKFRPDVTLEDLYTSHIMAAFRKPSKK